uniref:Uncharacterized protein n=1 Tax=Arundo donax TaxID=35708 RepID=A0A0A9CDG2_ARUDO
MTVIGGRSSGDCLTQSNTMLPNKEMALGGIEPLIPGSVILSKEPRSWR